MECWLCGPSVRVRADYPRADVAPLDRRKTKPHLRLHYSAMGDRTWYSVTLTRSAQPWRGARTFGYATAAQACNRARELWWGVGL